VPLGASLIPLKSTDSIMWTVKFRNGKIKRFKFATHTLPEGSVEPYKGLPDVSDEDLKNENLLNEKGKDLSNPSA